MSAHTIRFVLAAILLVFGARSAVAADSDPKVEKARQLSVQAADEKLTAEQRSEKRRELGRALRDLSDEQREQFMKSPEIQTQMQRYVDERQKQVDEMIDKYFALPADERTKFLDKQIDDSEKLRQALEKRRKERAAQAEQGKPDRDSSTPEAKPSDPNRRSRTLTPEATERAKALAERLAAKTTPEQKAKRQQYRDAMNKRRAERGLPPLPDRGPFTFGRPLPRSSDR